MYLNAPTLSVFNAQMFADIQVYLRGSLNGWGTDNPLIYQGNAIYSTSLDLDAGDYEFKIASEDWNTVDFGGVGGAPIVNINEIMLLEVIGGNIALSITESGNYTFKVIGPDKDNMNLLITKQ